MMEWRTLISLFGKYYHSKIENNINSVLISGRRIFHTKPLLSVFSGEILNDDENKKVNIILDMIKIYIVILDIQQKWE